MTSPRIDLRSDTVTRPSEGMLRAMMTAEVGDDVFGDDPTINRLQAEVADLLGKEAALFVPSGTMGNQLALKAHTSPGDQILLEEGAHIYRYEAGAPAVLGGLLVTCIESPRGWLEWEQIERALNPDNIHCAPPRVICLENTHNTAGGVIFPQDKMVEIGEQARNRGLKVHLDGRSRRFGQCLFFEGAGGSGGVGGGRDLRGDWAGPQIPQNVGWRDAPGGYPGRCLPVCPGTQHGPIGYGSYPCPVDRRWP